MHIKNLRDHQVEILAYLDIFQCHGHAFLSCHPTNTKSINTQTYTGTNIRHTLNIFGHQISPTKNQFDIN